MSDKTSLSKRIRPDCEAAPWVIKAVEALELENANLHKLVDNLETSLKDIRTYSSDTNFAVGEAIDCLAQIDKFYLTQ